MASKLWSGEWRECMHGRGACLTDAQAPGTQQHSLFTLGYLLYAVRLSLGGAAHRGNELLVCAQDLLCLHCDLLFTLHNLNLNLFLSDLLLLAGPL